MPNDRDKPAQPRSENEGEGNKTSAKEYDQAAERFARSGKVDQVQTLQKLSGYAAGFAPSLVNYDGGQYGVAVLSRGYVGYTTTGENAIVSTGPTNIDTLTLTHRVKIDYARDSGTYNSTITSLISNGVLTSFTLTVTSTNTPIKLAGVSVTPISLIFSYLHPSSGDDKFAATGLAP